MELTDITEIRALLSRHGFSFSKGLGQNFLCDAAVPRRIAECSGADRDTAVLEIGPGIGCLTHELCLRAGKVVSVELDRRLYPVLGETLAQCDNFELVPGDIMKLDLRALVQERLSGFPRRIVCANLPYNITSPVLTALIDSGIFDGITVMIQREVARRICAREGTADYGAFTVFVQWRCTAQQLFDVPPHCFIPAPKVTSSVIRLDKRPVPPFAVRDESLMFAVVRAAFNQRRKTLVNAVSSAFSARFSKETVASALEQCALDARIRGEALSIADFARLSDVLSDLEAK